MTATTQQLLLTFDQLPDTEQIEFAVEILRRLTNREFPPLSDDDLVFNAEDIFLALDAHQ